MSGRSTYFNENYFESIDTEDKAYWLGFIAADGCVYTFKRSQSSPTSPARRKLSIQLQDSDASHLQKFLDCMNSRHSVYHLNRFSTETKTACISIQSEKLCEDLKKYGIVERKTHILEPYILPNDLAKHYWRGYIDGDGSVFCDSLDRWFIAINANLSVCDAYVDYVSNQLGVEYSKIARVRHGITTYSVTYYKYKARDVSKLLYNDANIFLDFKKRKVDRLIKSLEN